MSFHWETVLQGRSARREVRDYENLMVFMIFRVIKRPRFSLYKLYSYLHLFTQNIVGYVVEYMHLIEVQDTLFNK